MNKKIYIYCFWDFSMFWADIFFRKELPAGFNYFYFIMSFFVYTLVLLLRSYKLNRIINAYTDMSYKEALSLTASSQLMGAFIPGRAGEILVSAYLKFKYTVDISKILPILFLDKIIELFCVLLYSVFAILMISGSLFSFVSGNFNGIKSNNYLVLFSVVIFLIVLILTIIKIYREKLKNILFNVKQSLLIPLKKPMLGVIIIFCSFFTIITEYFYLYLIFHAFNIEITLIKIIVTHSLGMIVGVLSMIPGGQGSTEVTMLAVLHFWGYTTLMVISPILASKALTYITLFVYALPLLPYSISVLKQRRTSRKRLKNG